MAALLATMLYLYDGVLAFTSAIDNIDTHSIMFFI
jgi:hypothetical protein